MRRQSPWVVAAVLLIAACTGRPPESGDIRTAFDPGGLAADVQESGGKAAPTPASGPLSGLRLGLVDGDNKRAAMATITARSQMFDPVGDSLVEYDPRRIATDLERALGARFKTVSPAESAAEAFARGEDVVLIVDMNVTIGTMSGMATTVTLTGTLQAPDGTTIGKAVGTGLNTIPYPARSVFRASWVRSLAEMVGRFDADAPRIAALAQQHGKTATAAPTDRRPASVAAPAVMAGPAKAPSRFPDQPVVARFPKAPVRPDDVAVIIGNADYARQGRDIPDVKPAHADAEGMRLYATQALGIKEGNVILLNDATGAQMARVFGAEREFRGQLYDWVRPGKSRVFVYYSGHGAPGRDGGSPFLVPTDADAARIEINGYPLKLLYDNLGRLPAESVTVVVEACFSGQSQGGSVVGQASPVFFDVKAPPVPANLTVITAGAAGQMASWEQDGSSGLFTKYFLKGMAGEADFDHDGRVTLVELDRYLKDTLTYLARRHYGRDQTAQIVKGGGP
jgi:hypothetical protein